MLFALPENSTGLPGRSGSLSTVVHVIGSVGSVVAPSKLMDRRSRPRRNLPLAERRATKSAPFGAAPGVA